MIIDFGQLSQSSHDVAYRFDVGHCRKNPVALKLMLVTIVAWARVPIFLAFDVGTMS
jgi:hypothetical protein